MISAMCRTSVLFLVACLTTFGSGPLVEHAAGRQLEVLSNPADSTRTLSASLERAQPGDSLMLAPGLYRGTFTLKRGVSIVGVAGPDSTILDAAGERYCLMGRDLDSTTVITGLTLQGGRRPHPNSGGGGIYLHRASPQVINNVFRNHLGYLGPGVYTNYFCRAVIAYNVFYANEGYLGGAIAAYQDCSPLVYNNILYDNQAVSGGAVLFMNSTGVAIGNTMVANGASQGGGGIYFDSSPALVKGNVIAHSRDSGALYCLDDDQPATLRDNLFWDNDEGTSNDLCPNTVTDGNCRHDPEFVDLAARRLERRAVSHAATAVAGGDSSPCRSNAGARPWDALVTPQVPDSILAVWRKWLQEHPLD